MSHEGNEVQVSFCPVPTPEVQADVLSVGVTEAELPSNAGEMVMINRGRTRGKA